MTYNVEQTMGGGGRLGVDWGAVSRASQSGNRGYGGVYGGQQQTARTQSTQNTTAPNPALTGYMQQYNTRLAELRASQNAAVDPARLSHNIDLANSHVAQASAGQQSNNARYAAALGGSPTALARLNRRTTEQQASTMAGNAARMTEEEQARVDAINEARRNALDQFTLAGLSGAAEIGREGLAQQGLGLSQLNSDRDYGLRRDDSEWARRMALMNLQLDTINSGGGSGGGSSSGGGYDYSRNWNELRTGHL